MDDRDLLLLKERVARRLISAAKREWSRLLLPAGARAHPALRKRA
ncbi:hypothetical protein [Lysobacter silvisoli]|nr:hypothetical protein [Lysobacter silvisoli]